MPSCIHYSSTASQHADSVLLRCAVMLLRAVCCCFGTALLRAMCCAAAAAGLMPGQGCGVGLLLRLHHSMLTLPCCAALLHAVC
jgi:hypothetical protein